MMEHFTHELIANRISRAR